MAEGLRGWGTVGMVVWVGGIWCRLRRYEVEGLWAETMRIVMEIMRIVMEIMRIVMEIKVWQ